LSVDFDNYEISSIAFKNDIMSVYKVIIEDIFHKDAIMEMINVSESSKIIDIAWSIKKFSMISFINIRMITNPHLLAKLKTLEMQNVYAKSLVHRHFNNDVAEISLNDKVAESIIQCDNNDIFSSLYVHDIFNKKTAWIDIEYPWKKAIAGKTKIDANTFTVLLESEYAEHYSHILIENDNVIKLNFSSKVNHHISNIMKDRRSNKYLLQVRENQCFKSRTFIFSIALKNHMTKIKFSESPKTAYSSLDFLTYISTSPPTYILDKHIKDFIDIEKIKAPSTKGDLTYYANDKIYMTDFESGICINLTVIDPKTGYNVMFDVHNAYMTYKKATSFNDGDSRYHNFENLIVHNNIFFIVFKSYNQVIVLSYDSQKKAIISHYSETFYNHHNKISVELHPIHDIIITNVIDIHEDIHMALLVADSSLNVIAIHCVKKSPVKKVHSFEILSNMLSQVKSSY
jgi:hypothetical protein